MNGGAPAPFDLLSSAFDDPAHHALRRRAPGNRTHQWPRWTTSSNGRRAGRRIGRKGRSAG